MSMSVTCAGREVANVLLELASTDGHDLKLEPAIWQSLLAAVDTDENGAIEWKELVTFFCDVFKHIERERQLDALQAKAEKEGEGAEDCGILAERHTVERQRSSLANGGGTEAAALTATAEEAAVDEDALAPEGVLPEVSLADGCCDATPIASSDVGQYAHNATAIPVHEAEHADTAGVVESATFKTPGVATSAKVTIKMGTAAEAEAGDAEEGGAAVADRPLVLGATLATADGQDSGQAAEDGTQGIVAAAVASLEGGCVPQSYEKAATNDYNEES
jgi:hypothetical protein